MKKFIVTFLFILMILPISSVLVSCKQKGYDLKNLSSDFYSIANNSNIKLTEKKLEIDFSGHKKLNSAVQSNEPYKQLVNYNYVLNNIMEFSFGYVGICSDDLATKDADLKNRIETDLKNLKDSYAKVNASIDDLGKTLTASNPNINDSACLALYENLLLDYEQLFAQATNFNNSLAILYFNHLLTNPNPDVYSMGKENFDATLVVQRLDARIKYQISLKSQCFAETYLKNEGMAHKVAIGDETVNLSTLNYKNSIDGINKSFTLETAIEKANNSANKETFYEYAVKAQIFQAIIDDEISKFIYAINQIDYNDVSAEKSSAHELMCKEIILSCSSLFTEYNNKALIHMVDIIT